MPVDYEKLGLFYLGKRYDLASGTRQAEPILYDSKDLVTHAVCVGMTGSGKTGLGIGLIEEAAIDGIPVLAIDPKGDLSNLLLTFPGLAPSDFRPWVDPSDAAARGMTPDQLAEDQAATWAKGLAEWDQSGDRIAALKRTATVRVYTPGSRAGTPLALLRSLHGASSENDEDARARVTSTAASLLALAGYAELGPHDRELTFVSAILTSAAASSSSADLPWLVQQIQRPAFDRVGVLDLETFYPAKDRQELALRFNSVLASPGFDVWLDGAPLDVGAMLHDAAGKPGIAVVSIAHLGDAERMLVVSLVLNALLEWTRRQTGTGSLRALLVHGRSVRLPAAGRQPAVQAAAADAAQAGARLRRRHRAGDAEPGRPGLQGAVEHRHLVPRQAADRARQEPRARRPGGSHERPRPRHTGQDAVVAQEARVPDAQRARQRAGGVRDPVDAVVPARTHGTGGAETRDRGQSRRPPAAETPRADDAATGSARGAISGRQAGPAGQRARVLPAATRRRDVVRAGPVRCRARALHRRQAEHRHRRGPACGGALRGRRGADRLGSRRAHRGRARGSGGHASCLGRSGALSAAAACRSRCQAVCRLDQGLPAVGAARRAADALRRAGAEAHVAGGRERARLPTTGAAGVSARPATPPSRSCATATRRKWRGSPSASSRRATP